MYFNRNQLSKKGFISPTSFGSKFYFREYSFFLEYIPF